MERRTEEEMEENLEETGEYNPKSLNLTITYHSPRNRLDLRMGLILSIQVKGWRGNSRLIFMLKAIRDERVHSGSPRLQHLQRRRPKLPIHCNMIR